jgi:hypothetical protein
LQVHLGEISAAVQGSRAKPYKVTVRVRTYSDKEWKRTIEALASQVGHLAALLDGEMPPGVADDLAAAKIDLLPVSGEVQPRCSCPDQADPCKHSAAVCYLAADLLDADPFLLFVMRGRDRETLLEGLRGKRALATGMAGNNASPAIRAGLGGGIDDLGANQLGSWDAEVGLSAADVWKRWAKVSADGVPPVPAIPLPPSKHGRPTILAVDPPADAGVSSESLQRLAADAAQRACELAHGEPSSGLELSSAQDLARRAATMLGPEQESGEIRELASLAGVPARDLLSQARAWRDGGSEGFFVLSESWDPPSHATRLGRALLGGSGTVRRNRVTFGDRQVRLGRDGRWYPFLRSGRTAASWTPNGAPAEVAAQPQDAI